MNKQTITIPLIAGIFVLCTLPTQAQDGPRPNINPPPPPENPQPIRDPRDPRNPRDPRPPAEPSTPEEIEQRLQDIMVLLDLQPFPTSEEAAEASSSEQADLI